MEDAQKGPPKSEIIVLAEVEYIQGIILDHKINIDAFSKKVTFTLEGLFYLVLVTPWLK